MTLKAQPALTSNTDQFSTQKRFECTEVKNVTFGTDAAAPLVALLTPVAYNENTGYWAKWAKPTQDVYTIAVTTDYTSGTFTVTIDGETSGTIASSASLATVQAAVDALSNVRSGDIVVTEAAAGGVDIDLVGFIFTFATTGNFRGRAITMTADFGSLVGGTGAAITNTVAGVEANGTDIPKAFVAPTSIQTYADGETVGVVMWAGKVHIDDITVESADDSDFQYIAKKTFRGLGIRIESLAGIR